MNPLVYERLHDNLLLLKLNTVEQVIDNVLEIASKEGKNTVEILDHLLEHERKHRETAAVERRIKLAVFPSRKTLEDFNFEFQQSLDRKVIEDLATLRFVHNAENVVFLGPPGVGKSHLAIALGMESAKAGMSVYFINAGNLIEKLKKANREGLLEKKLKDFNKYRLLIVDEVGYLPFDEEGVHCFFQLISKRYEKNSIIFTSNKSYGQWVIFQDNDIASAVLDSILHHCTTINIKGDSYKLKDRQKVGLKTVKL